MGYQFVLEEELFYLIQIEKRNIIIVFDKDGNYWKEVKFLYLYDGYQVDVVVRKKIS